MLVTFVALVVTVVLLEARSRAPGPRGPGSCPHTARAVGATDTAAPSGTVRPLTWAEGRRVHVGNATVTVARTPLSLDVVDGGAAFTTLDGGIWFTDGLSVVQIGLTSSGQRLATGLRWGASGKPHDWVVSDNTGSRLAWFEYPNQDRPEIVVYDAAQRRRVARHPVDERADCPRCAQLLSVDDRHVHWTEGLWRGYGTAAHLGARRSVLRLDLATGQVLRVPDTCLASSLRTRPRMLVVGAPAGISLSDGIGQEFASVGGRLVATTFDSGSVVATGSDEPLRLRAPRGYGSGPNARLVLFQWLDDERFALVDTTAWVSGVHRGEDLLVCTLSAHRCVVAVRRPLSADGLVLPEVGTPGSQQAVDR